MVYRKSVPVLSLLTLLAAGFVPCLLGASEARVEVEEFTLDNGMK